MLENTISAENLRVLIDTFYPEVLKDDILAPFFIEKLGEDIESEAWKEHLTLLFEFWKFVALGYENYEGNPLQPHFDIAGLSREAFGQWLKLFFESIDTIYEPFAGQYLKDKSNDIAQNFIRKLAL